MSVVCEAMVLGGGLAGAAVAVHLARAGRDVVLVEREAEPKHKVCGEFLSQEAIESLDVLGIDLSSLGAVALEGVRFAGPRGTTSASLPFAAMSLTRRTLDEALLQQATAAGARVLRGVRVQTLERAANAEWKACFEGGEGLQAPAVFVATGKHDLRGRPRPAGVQPGLVGFKMYFHLSDVQSAQLGRYVALLTYPGGYGGLQPVEDGAVNLCCLFDRALLQKTGARWEDLLLHVQRHCPYLEERLQGAQPLLEKPLAIAPIPYGYVRADAEDGLWHLGDQAAVIPSFTGDGMSIALHSAALAASMYLNEDASVDFQRRLRRELATQVGLATALSRGLLWAPTRRLMAATARRWPETLGAVARATRLSRTARKTLVLPRMCGARG